MLIIQKVISSELELELDGLSGRTSLVYTYTHLHLEEKSETEDEMVGWHHWLTGKDPDAGKDWGQEEKGTAEDELVGRHHQLSGHDSEQSWDMVKEAWHAAIHGVTKSRTWLSNPQQQQQQQQQIDR